MCLPNETRGVWPDATAADLQGTKVYFGLPTGAHMWERPVCRRRERFSPKMEIVNLGSSRWDDREPNPDSALLSEVALRSGAR